MTESRVLPRRAFFEAVAASVVAGLVSIRALDSPASLAQEPAMMPVVFLSHGAPTLALDAKKGADFAAWGRALPRPSAIVVVSAHWEDTPARVGTTEPRDLIYDFHGFPRALHELRYDAPGAGELGARVAEMVGAAAVEEERGWDHGVWVPLVHMFPDADVPVLQVSLPSVAPPREIAELGRKLAPLRREGVLLLASGGMVHNLGRIDWTERAAPEAWASDFDGWMREKIEAEDLDAVLDFAAKAPALRLAHPTLEHILPLMVAVGATLDAPAKASFPIEGFEYGNLGRRGVQWG